MAEKHEITPEEHQLLDGIVSEYKQALLRKDIQKEAFEEGVEWLYEKLLKLPKPKIFYFNNPMSKQEIWQQSNKIKRLAVQNALDRYINDLTKKQNIRLNNLFVRSVLLENLYIHHYKTFIEMVSLHRKNGINLKQQLERLAYTDFYIQSGQLIFPDFSYLKKLCCSGAFHVFIWENTVFAIASPNVRQDEHRQLHSTVYPAIEWPEGPKAYYVHGRETPEWVFSEYGTNKLYRRFLREENADTRAAIITVIKEREGHQGLLEFLKAELVDEKEVVHSLGYKEILRLYKSKEKFDFLQDRRGKSGQPYCWSEFTCPSTGSTYLIDNSADFTDAIKAAKFLRPDFVPTGLAYRWSHDAC